ncbi:MAG TPA: GAF domain-containing protein [Chloroflexota bacterium]|nr:GAF domain-containing protein [Chloroflexota bacterium]
MYSDTSLGRYFDALYQITLRLSSSLDLDNVLTYLTEETAQAVVARAASVRLLNSTGERLEMRAVYGLSAAYLNKGPVELARSPVDRDILAGTPSQLEDVTTDASFQYPEEAAREGIVSVASVPLIARGSPIGVLRVYSAERRRFSDSDMRFLVAVADLAALCIENARLYEGARQNYEETMNILWGAEPGG